MRKTPKFNRLLSKPSEPDLMEGDPALRTAAYFNAREDLSTGSTQQKTDYGDFERNLMAPDGHTCSHNPQYAHFSRWYT
ncbi:MAG: palindromic element RPE1 domain-containing protein [Holosporales bacterium]|nr:palindromic element RPE1 domain-containing protein [Holosporales bacterium]